MGFQWHYILNDKGEPVPEPDLIKWAQWFEATERHVGDERVGKFRISTVFLGLDHSYSEQGPPLLWETMVFADGDPNDHDMTRCSGSREQAEAMHQKMVELIKATMDKGEN